MQNKTQWFAGFGAEADIKSRYRELAREHHPDMGGSTATMQDINAQYESALRGDYARQGMSQEKANERWAMDEEIARKAQEIIRLSKALHVEVCGVWLWVTGETYHHAAALKALACRWAPKKAAWYFRRERDGGQRWHRGRHYSLNDIRAKYGSSAIRREEAAPAYATIGA